MGTGHIYYSKPALFTCYAEFSVIASPHPDGVLDRQHEDHSIALPGLPALQRDTLLPAASADIGHGHAVYTDIIQGYKLYIALYAN